MKCERFVDVDDVPPCLPDPVDHNRGPVSISRHQREFTDSFCGIHKQYAGVIWDSRLGIRERNRGQKSRAVNSGVVEPGNPQVDCLTVTN